MMIQLRPERISSILLVLQPLFVLLVVDHVIVVRHFISTLNYKYVDHSKILFLASGKKKTTCQYSTM